MDMRVLLLTILGLISPLFCSCEPMAYVIFPKTTGQDVIAQASQEDAWFVLHRDDADSANGDSFTTKNKHYLHVPNVDFGCWAAYSLKNPQLKVMEARGATLLLENGYHWDGMSLGETSEEELKASLFHDALYEAIQSGAPVDRCDADRVFLAALRAGKASNADNFFWFVRMTGWFYNDYYTEPSLQIVTKS